MRLKFFNFYEMNDVNNIEIFYVTSVFIVDFSLNEMKLTTVFKRV